MRAYRAWHLHKKRYYEVEMVDFVGNKVFLGDDIKGWVHFDYVILEQESGFIDMNMKPIFEGSIIEYFGRTYEIAYDEESARYIMIENQPGRNLVRTLGLDWGHRYKIVGNIHEKE